MRLLRYLSERQWPAPTIVVLATLLAFSPVLQNEFVDWDDQANFVTNSGFRGLGWDQLVWMATAFHLGVYQPLAWLAVGIEYTLGGLHPSVYHAASWLFHAATAGLVYGVILLIVGRNGGSPLRARLCAGIAALLFAVHPQRVEAVAWASAQGYPLAGAFAAASIISYLRAHPPGATDPPRWNGWVIASIGLAWLAYLSKPIAVTLPAALILLDWYPLNRWRSGRLIPVMIEKLPYAIPAALIAAAAPLARTHAGLLEGDHYGPLLRLGQAAYGLVFYLWKTIAPFDLTFYYPLPLDADPLQARFTASGVILVLLVAAIWRWHRRWPGLAPAALAYVALLSPVLGLIPQGGQLAADRYTYFASVPVAVLVGAALYAAWPWISRRAPWQRWMAGGLAVAACIGLGALTWRQTTAWHNAETLWAHAVDADPGAFQSHNNLGLAYLSRKDYDAALGEFERAVALNPRSAKAHFNRGLSLAKLNRREDAVAAYREGLALRPADPTARAHLAELLSNAGRFPEAEAEYRIALSLTAHPDLFNGLGTVLAEQGRIEEAAAAFRQALALDPTHADAKANLDMALRMTPTE